MNGTAPSILSELLVYCFLEELNIISASGSVSSVSYLKWIYLTNILLESNGEVYKKSYGWMQQHPAREITNCWFESFITALYVTLKKEQPIIEGPRAWELHLDNYEIPRN